MSDLTDRLRQVATWAKNVQEVGMAADAWEVWDGVYESLTSPPAGLLGAMVSRAEAQTRRLAVIYALLDRSTIVTSNHLRAALAVWRYCAASAGWIFGNRLGDSTADTLLEAIRRSPEGLARAAIHSKVFGGHKKSDEIARALQVLARERLVHSEQVSTDGRAAEVWVAG